MTKDQIIEELKEADNELQNKLTKLEDNFKNKDNLKDSSNYATALVLKKAFEKITIYVNYNNKIKNLTIQINNL